MPWCDYHGPKYLTAVRQKLRQNEDQSLNLLPVFASAPALSASNLTSNTPNQQERSLLMEFDQFGPKKVSQKGKNEAREILVSRKFVQIELVF